MTGFSSVPPGILQIEVVSRGNPERYAPVASDMDLFIANAAIPCVLLLAAAVLTACWFSGQESAPPDRKRTGES
jgi:hypothetical protein